MRAFRALRASSFDEPNRLLRFQRTAVNDPGTVCQWMLGFDLSSFNGQPKRDAAHLHLMRSLGESEPAFGFATVVAIGGYAVMTAQRGHPFTGPAVSHPCDQPAAGQNAGNRFVRADAHQHAHRLHNLLRRVSSAVAASSARNAKLRMHAPFQWTTATISP